MGQGAKVDWDQAREMGLNPQALQQLLAVIEQDTTKGVYDGAVIALGRSGRMILHEAIGFADRAKNRQVRRDDIFFIMSITKTFTAAMVLSRIERGELALTTPVAEVIPEFGVKGKQRVTVYHLLTHQGGISSDLPLLLPLDQVGNLQAYVAAAANEPLRAKPGQLVWYSIFTGHALLAEMVRRLDGGQRPFRRMLAEDLFEPLKMKDTALGLRPDLVSRLAPLVYRDSVIGLFEPMLVESMNVLFTEETELPAGGAISTAGDIYRWAEMLRRGGELEGARVLSPGMIEMATQVHTGSKPNHLFDYACEMHGWDQFPANLGFSFFLRGEDQHPAPMGSLASPFTFAGLGAGSTMFWVDPDRDLSFVFLSTGLLEEGRNFLRLQKLSDLVLTSVLE
ncbi:MAG: serine hydrolase domain-containing protein [Thermodesulfobacteriota bacterium]